VCIYANMVSQRKEREKRRKMEEMTRGEEVLINLSSLPFQFYFSSFSLSLLRMDVLLRRRYIHAACALYLGKHSSPGRQFLQFINVYISAFNVTICTIRT